MEAGRSRNRTSTFTALPPSSLVRRVTRASIAAAQAADAAQRQSLEVNASPLSPVVRQATIHPAPARRPALRTINPQPAPTVRRTVPTQTAGVASGGQVTTTSRAAPRLTTSSTTRPTSSTTRPTSSTERTTSSTTRPTSSSPRTTSSTTRPTSSTARTTSSTARTTSSTARRNSSTTRPTSSTARTTSSTSRTTSSTTRTTTNNLLTVGHSTVTTRTRGATTRRTVFSPTHVLREPVVRKKRSKSLAPSSPILANSDEETKDDCPVCFEEWAKVKWVALTACGHQFCTTCIKQFKTFPIENQTCPLCRAPCAADLIKKPKN